MALRRFNRTAATVFVAIVSLPSAVAAAETAPVAIALHGGAGTITRTAITSEQDAAYREILSSAIDYGHTRLLAGADGLDVVVEVIQIMEQSPLFNAGIGAVMTWEGKHELDASIMTGANLDAGAVAGVTTIASPIAAARAVMEHSPHVMLSGAGAEVFARDQGLELVDNATFTTERRKNALERYKSKVAARLTPDKDYKYGTVGVVVLDANGDLAAGTSTGGMTGKRWGRIGDAPIIGAGTYANNASCAVSATGHGEFFIRYHVAGDICSRMQYQGISLTQAADTVINGELARVGGEGGVVAVDARGNVAMPFNSEGMYRASIDAAGHKTVAIYGIDD